MKRDVLYYFNWVLFIEHHLARFYYVNSDNFDVRMLTSHV